MSTKTLTLRHSRLFEVLHRRTFDQLPETRFKPGKRMRRPAPEDFQAVQERALTSLTARN